MFNVGKVAGPAVAGILISTVGLAPSFFVNAASFVAVLVGLSLIRTGELIRTAPARRARGQLREGLRYVRGRPDLLAPLALMTVTGLLAYEWTVILPLLARDTFDGGADAVGLTFTAMGAGAIVGGLALAGVLKATTNRLVALGLAFAGALLATAAAPSLTFALCGLVVVGAASVAFRAIASSVLQLRADPEMRGRVVGAPGGGHRRHHADRRPARRLDRRPVRRADDARGRGGRHRSGGLRDAALPAPTRRAVRDRRGDRDPERGRAGAVGPRLTGYSGVLPVAPADQVRRRDALVHEVRDQALGRVRQVVAVVHPDARVVGRRTRCRTTRRWRRSSESTHHGLPVAGTPSRASTTAWWPCRCIGCDLAAVVADPHPDDVALGHHEHRHVRVHAGR